MSDTAGEVVLPQRLAIKRVAKTTATPDDPVNYPTIELLHESESGIACSNYDFVFKIILVGDSGVGKSNLLSRFTHNIFNPEERATIGVDMMTRDACIHGQFGPVTVRLQIWDSAGQERFRAMSSVFYRNASAALLVYDITDPKSFTNTSNWLRQIRSYSSDAVILLVGNKCDLAHLRVVLKQSGVDFAKENKLLFHETSAFDSTNVFPAFLEMLRKTFVRFEEEQKQQQLAEKAMAEEEESADDDATSVDNMLDGEESNEDTISEESKVRAAARIVTKPLRKVKRLSTVVLGKGEGQFDDEFGNNDDGLETPRRYRRYKKKRGKCCRKG